MSDRCIAAHPSDMCVALAALDATVQLSRPVGAREIPIRELHLLPGEHPETEFALEPGELITSVTVPTPPLAARSVYVKVRDRASYAFALASCGRGPARPGRQVEGARIALGGIGTKPWRVPDAEAALAGEKPDTEAFRRAADIAFAGARPRRDNAFKVELGKRTVVRALQRALEVA